MIYRRAHIRAGVALLLSALVLLEVPATAASPLSFKKLTNKVKSVAQDAANTVSKAGKKLSSAGQCMVKKGLPQGMVEQSMSCMPMIMAAGGAVGSAGCTALYGFVNRNDLIACFKG